MKQPKITFIQFTNAMSDAAREAFWLHLVNQNHNGFTRPATLKTWKKRLDEHVNPPSIDVSLLAPRP